MDKKKLSGGISIGAAIAVTAALAVGGYSILHGAGQSATADVTTYTGPVATSVAPPAQDDAAAQSIYDQQIAQQKADAEAAAAAQAAAEAAAAQAAADAAAKAAAPKRAASTNGAPSGTPLPMTLVTDPNNGNYGSYEPADPGSFCASHSGSTINGVPTCD